MLDQAAGDKSTFVAPAAGGGTSVQPWAGDPGAPCLDAGALVRLAALGAACERQLGPGQDVEWALAGDRLHLLQSRPITAR